MESGLELLQKVWSCYSIAKSKKVAFYSKGGQEQIICHELNKRHQSQVILSYAQKVKKFGNVQDVRGAAWAQASEKDDGTQGPPYRMVSYGRA